MRRVTLQWLHLALLLLSFGGQPPLQSGVMALPTSPAGSRRGSADSEHAAHIPRPRVGIVVKNNATAPQFRGAIFDDDLTARDEYGNESSATLSDTSADPRSVVDDQVPSRPGAFESNPDQVLYTLPLTKVDGVHVKASQELQPVDHFKRHLEAAHHRLAAIRRRRVESVLLSERGEEAPPAGFGESAIPLDPSLNVGGADQDVPTPDPIEASQESGPRLWRGTGTGHFGRDPAVVRLPARKRLLGGLIGALGGDTSATPSGFSGSNSSSANSTASDSEDQAATWNEPVSKIRGNPSSSKDNSIGYPIKALEVATSAAVTSAQHTTAEQSLGLDIEANDVGYIATIQIGSNHKPFRMLIDSGSADTWVASSSCTGCGTHHQRLGPETSKSFKPTSNKFSITYGTGSVSGLLGHDEVDIAGLKLSNHTIGVALQQSRDFTDATVPFDGLMGLARSELSNAGTPTPIDALFASGQVSAPVMGYRLGRVADGRNDGEVTFGGVDRQRFTGNLIEVENISKEGFWEAAMGGVSFGGRDIGLHGRTAILDTGTTLIVAPKEDADAVHAAIPGSKSDGQGGYYIPCTTTQSLALTFGGQSFPIDPRDMLFLPVDQDDLQGDCISAISSGQVGQDNEWLVGAVWLKNLYFATNSRTNTIGLGKLKSS